MLRSLRITLLISLVFSLLPPASTSAQVGDEVILLPVVIRQNNETVSASEQSDTTVFFPLLSNGEPINQTVEIDTDIDIIIPDESEPDGSEGQSEEIQPTGAAVVPSTKASKLVYADTEMEFGSGVVEKDTEIEITPLDNDALPPLDPGMVNVTKGPRHGYRYLPHMQFEKNFTISLPYDESLIPAGSTSKDIKTFYYDEAAGRWKELKRVAVDTDAKMVRSHTDHFTDMINATITVPDHPQALHHNPTSIKDIKAADPGAGINLIEPPVANNMGDARLSYPIEVPPGRVGMQPDLALTYNSSGGNGWVGLGWDLNVPSITVETRWGVPRYDPSNETETYLLNGEMLTPVVHRSELLPRSGDAEDGKVFHTRTEGQFRRIIRYGDSPSTYMWIVTDKDGKRHAYGGNLDTKTPTPNLTLTDDSGNIFKWALSEVRDLNKNSIKYSCEVVKNVGIDGGVVPGRQLYLSSINYTGSIGTDDGRIPGAYTVSFERMDGRKDVNIDARGGFKMVTADLLRTIKIELTDNDGTHHIRSYNLNYAANPDPPTEIEEGAFYKTLLRSIDQLGEDGEVFNSHSFAYFNNEVPRTAEHASYDAFEGEMEWTTGNDKIAKGFFGPLNALPFGSVTSNLEATALGGSFGDNVGGHIYVGINPSGPTKGNSAGAKIGFTHSDTEGALTLIDIDGDSLPDKVYKKNGGLSYRKNLSGPSGNEDYGEEIPITLGEAEPEFMKETSDTFSFGGEVYISYFNGLLNKATTLSTTSVYFSDVNGDGLPDLVQNGKVYFNRLNNGIPEYLTSSQGTPDPIDESAASIASDVMPDLSDIKEDMEKQFPLHDTVTRWISPFSGTVTISGDVSMLEQPTCEQITDPRQKRACKKQENYEHADGVIVSIEHHTGVATDDVPAIATPLYSQTLTATQTTPITPVIANPILVEKGDRIYFRVHSIYDGLYDQVKWDPEINFQTVNGAAVDPTITDANMHTPYRYKMSDDFALTGPKGIGAVMPITGTVELSGTFKKSATATDNIQLIITKVGQDTSGVIASSTISKTLIPFGSTDSFDFGDFPSIPVNQNDIIQLDLAIDSSIDLSIIELEPEFYYSAFADGTPITEENKIEEPIPYSVDTYPNTTDDSAPQSWVATDEATINIEPSIEGAPNANISGIFTVKSQGKLRAKEEFSVAGTIVNIPQISGLAVEAGEELFFNFTVMTTTTTAGLANPSVKVTVGGTSTNVPATLNGLYQPTQFSTPYRNWSFAGYRSDDASALIVEKNFKLPDYNENNLPINIPEGVDFAELSDEERDEAMKPIQEEGEAYSNSRTVYPFASFPKDEMWRGDDEHGWVKAGQMSSSRLGLDTISVPSADDLTGEGVRAVSKIGTAEQTSKGGGISLLSYSDSDGKSRSKLDFMDMNGDRFPDILNQDAIQFSTMLGGLENGSTTMSITVPIEAAEIVTGIRNSGNDAWNFGIGGSAAQIQVNGKGRGNKSGTQMVSLGISAGIGAGNSDAQAELMDINGDGLPDRVKLEDGKLMAALNLGYSFAKPEPWGDALLSDGESESANIGLSPSYNDGVYGFSGGLSFNKGKSATKQNLLDVNGDGLLDRAILDGGEVIVHLNLGNKFAEQETVWMGSHKGGCESPFSLPPPFSDQTPRQLVNEIPLVDIGEIPWDDIRLCNGNSSVGGGLYATIPIPIPFTSIFLITNPGADYSQNMSRQEGSFQDVNGDGYVDYVTSEDATAMNVSLSKIDRTNLLKTVERPLGATIEIDYERDGNTYELPQSRWVMSTITVTDGYTGTATTGQDIDGVDVQVKTYKYEDGFYHREERDFYGYATVVEEHRNTTNVSGDPTELPLYRSITREYRTDSFYTKGLLTSEYLQDDSEAKYTETINEYIVRDIDSGEMFTTTESQVGTFHTQLITTTQNFYEGQPDIGKTTYVTYEYDDLGNVTTFFDAGDVGSTDDVRADITYSACSDTYVVGAPLTIRVLATDRPTREQEMRNRVAEIDCATGNMTRVSQYLLNGDEAETKLGYFPDGNLAQVTYPTNKNEERYVIRYEYDGVTATHVKLIRDSFGYESKASHNLKYGQVAESIDINGNPITYAYDQFGRVDYIVGPYQEYYENEEPAETLGEKTIQFEYHHQDSDRPPWALTKHIDSYRSETDTIDTVLFTDGLKRILQTKKDITVHSNADAEFEFLQTEDMVSVSGRVEFDFVGRTIATYYPTLEEHGENGLPTGEFNKGVDGVVPTKTQYDVLDRTRVITIPDTTTNEMLYGFGLDRNDVQQFETTVIDRNGTVKKTHRDVRQLITSVWEEYDPTDDHPDPFIWMSYQYDPLKQITEVSDDQGNLTTVRYDNFGRRTRIDNPDTGETQMIYDLASNLSEKITENLRGVQDKAIVYDYEYNRLASISYPDFTENNVTYTYGGPGVAFNRAGRIRKVTSEAGDEERFYGKLGETVKTIKTVDSDLHVTDHSYTTEMTYDTWGRLQELVYPDGEILTHEYDSGGLPRRITGELIVGREPTIYLERLEYDRFEQRVFMEMGNGTRTTYEYQVDNRRLANLQAGEANDRLFQNLRYEYDGVGNVTRLANALVPSQTDLGGPADQTFTYDKLYRLVQADGTYTTPDAENSYSLTMIYDSIHNIVNKDQIHEIIANGETFVQGNTSYDWAYQYNNGGTLEAPLRPHAPSKIGNRIFSYDDNGNQTSYEDRDTGRTREILWDEENRIQRILDLNADGTPVLRNPDDEVDHTHSHEHSHDHDDDIADDHDHDDKDDCDKDDCDKDNCDKDDCDKDVELNAAQTANAPMHEEETGSVNFKYDDVGERVLKQSPLGETAYINPYYVVHDLNKRTKHVFVGNTRLASSVVTIDPSDDLVTAAEAESPAEQAEAAEIEQSLRNRYFYHPDHLGSSNYVTDAEGEIYQHMEYFPFGEMWVEEVSGDSPTPYLFTSKELDVETSLYYFGARYYDPRMSVWQSTDPILNQYLDGQPNDGIFNSLNLGLYSYAYQSPLKLKDPNGLQVADEEFGKPAGRIPVKDRGKAPPESEMVTMNKYGDTPEKGQRKFKLHKDAARSFKALRAAAKESGFDKEKFTLTSAFRDPKKQKRLFKAAIKKHGSEKEARKWVAKTSEHGTGMTFDLNLGIQNSSENAKSGAFSKLKEYKWLKDNSANFGLNPYSREPWHWTYNVEPRHPIDPLPQSILP